LSLPQLGVAPVSASRKKPILCLNRLVLNRIDAAESVLAGPDYNPPAARPLHPAQ
jgi:hypothetical protein